MKPLLAAAALAAAFALPVHAAPGEPIYTPVKDYDVYVDTPTGFVFVKLPAGWKFVGKVDEEALARLPSNVLTALLRYRDEDLPVDVARRK